MTTIKQGDIVHSNGRIASQQEGRRRYIEFEAALVLDTGPDGVTVNPVGMKAVLLCQRDDLHLTQTAVKAAPDVKLAGTVVEPTTPVRKPAPKAAPTLKGLKPAAKPKPEAKPAAKKRPAAKRTAMRRRPTS